MSWQIFVAVNKPVWTVLIEILFSLAMLVIDRSSVKADTTLSLEALEIEQYLFTNSDWAIDQRSQVRHLTRCLANLIMTGKLALAVG